MRKFAKYSFIANEVFQFDWDFIVKSVEDWLAYKGGLLEQSSELFRLKNGILATLCKRSVRSNAGEVCSWQLEEPQESGLFKTTVELTKTDHAIAFYCELEAGNPAYLLAPVFFEAHCPYIVRTLVRSRINWMVGETNLPKGTLHFVGEPGFLELPRLIGDSRRNLPLICVSKGSSQQLPSNFADRLADELAGLALVAEIDGLSSWGITHYLGQEWSCYGGAVRLYWPLTASARDPYQHPLWTPERLFADGLTSEDVSSKLRNSFRKKIFSLSTLTLHRPAMTEQVEESYRRQELERRLKEASETNDYVDLAQSYADDNNHLRQEIDELKNELQLLRVELQNSRAIHNWQTQEESELPVSRPGQKDFENVAQAVEVAREIFGEVLTFGNDVPDGIQSLAEDAGPPQKIFDYLSAIAELCQAKRAGPLGSSAINWLKKKGFDASGESETIKNSQKEMGLRTWHDGSGSRQFTSHLKPTNGTSPDRCVRIYFDWVPETKKFVVGWVGRHPGT